ncbi:putative amino acid dehydrogenase [Inhella inkyongensis]|uniref:Putative amino acid dehydrogenase n=1 Tax=Inhella inkyongensis TaxID=392593 RepID=A0A840S949_9BURK|nr:hypothetical protein [Inhella inkyongensis]MBB5204939.1 putative amino acid dehydrogenase [Inhella inkyongensis]
MLPHASTLWRAALRTTDLPRHWRVLTSQPRLDVVFITNVRDEAERRRFFADPNDRLQHASGPRMRLRGVHAQVRGFNVTAEELLTRPGRKLARELFIECTRWAQDQGARVVLLAASTKRLFGRDGGELKAMFPDLVFTIGDNGTAWLLGQDVERALRRANLSAPARLLVIGPYGILGSAVAEHLAGARHEVIGWGPSTALLQEWSQQTGLSAALDFESIGKVDAVVCCSHSPEAKLTLERVQQLRRTRRKLLVIDVCEPANLDAEELARCGDLVRRQDAGNAHAKGLSYGLGPLSWQRLQLSRGTVFGCFAEAIALYQAIFRDRSSIALRRDWFEVSAFNQFIVAETFRELGIQAPEPHCFGRRVTRFDLRREEAQALPQDTPFTLPNPLQAR